MFTLQKNHSFRATMIHDITYMDPREDATQDEWWEWFASSEKPKTWAGDKKIKVVFSSLSWPRSRLYERVLDELSMDSVAHDITEAGVQMSTDNPIWRIHNLEHDLRFTSYPVQSIIISCQSPQPIQPSTSWESHWGQSSRWSWKTRRKPKALESWNQRQVRLPPPEVEFRRRGVPWFRALLEINKEEAAVAAAAVVSNQCKPHTGFRCNEYVHILL